MPLKGIKVLELAGLAPGPFCGKILADFGAKVTRIDKVVENHLDVLQNGKQTIALNLKHPKGQQFLKQLVKSYDVLIEPFRPGVMERLNLGPDVLCQENPRLIYARLTGFGQTGPLAQRAGHDINYSALSGVHSMLDSKRPPMLPPFLADFVGGGLLCALGICMALLERHRSNCGQVIDASMVEGAAYAASWLFVSHKIEKIIADYAGNLLNGGCFYYGIFETKDGGFMSVGPIEGQFFDIFKERLNLPQLTQTIGSKEEGDEKRKSVEHAFLQKTLSEWTHIFESCDACVFPLVNWNEAMHHPQHKARESFVVIDKTITPTPAPRLSRTPGKVKLTKNQPIQIHELLMDLPISKNELQQLIDEKIIELPHMEAKL